MSNDTQRRFQEFISTQVWQEIKSWAEGEIQGSMERSDNIPAKEFNLSQFCEQRGIRQGMRNILSHIEFMAEKGE